MVKLNFIISLVIWFIISVVVSDGSNQWEIQDSGVTNSLYDVCFVDSFYGWAVGANATIIATTDGGKTWARQIEPVDTIEFRNIKFVNRQVGFIGGNRIVQFAYYWRFDAILLRTTNGGQNWEECELGFGPAFYFADLDFFDVSKGWLAINNNGTENCEDRGGILLKTENGGKKWTVLLRKKPDIIGAIAFRDNKHGYSFWGPYGDNFDASNAYLTVNGGLTWTWVGKIQDLVRDVEVLSPNTLWAIGYRASKSEDSGQNWFTWNWDDPVYEGLERFNPIDIKVFDPNIIWLIGSASRNQTDIVARLITTYNSGETWGLELETSDSFFSGLSVVSNQHAWIVGAKGLILHRKLSSPPGSGIIPQSFTLEQNYPNPFSSSDATTTIRFSIKSQQHITIAIYDILGREINILLSEIIGPGSHSITWDGRDNSKGLKVPAGIYFYELRSPSFTCRKKMLLIQ